MDSSGYRDLAAEVVHLAVDDLQKVYIKVKRWDELDKSGQLKAYVAEKGIGSSYLRVSRDEQSAVNFLGGRADKLRLYMDMLNSEALPKPITDQVNFISANEPTLIRKINSYKGRITIDKRVADEERTNSGQISLNKTIKA